MDNILKFTDYTKNNVLNFIASILSHYKTNYNHSTIDSINFSSNKTLLFLLDAVGYNQFIEQFPNFSPLKLRTVFPSTTATALTSLFTEKDPIQHGVLGFTTYLQHYGIIANCISMKSTIGNIDVTDFFHQNSTIFQQLQNVNVSTYSLLPHSISSSGLSKILYTGSKIVPYYSFADLFTVLNTLKNLDEKQFIAAYYPNYDTICHKYGPDSENSKKELKNIFNSIWKFSKTFDNYNIFVIADHGQIETPKNKFYFWSEFPFINKNFIIPPFCEPRVNMFFSQKDLKDDLKNEFDNFIFYTKEEALNKQIFGNGDKFKSRLGENILIFKDNTVLMSQMSPFYPPPVFLGMHGSISDNEMYVPLIQLR